MYLLYFLQCTKGFMFFNVKIKKLKALHDKVADLEKKVYVHKSKNFHRIKEEIIIKAIHDLASKDDQLMYDEHLKQTFHICNDLCLINQVKFMDVWPIKCKIMQGITILKANSQAREYVKKHLIKNLSINFEEQLTVKSYNNAKIVHTIFSDQNTMSDLRAYISIASNIGLIKVKKGFYKFMTRIGRTLDKFYNYTNRFTSVEAVFENPRVQLPNNISVDDMVNYYFCSFELLIKASRYLFTYTVPLAKEVQDFSILTEILQSLYEKQKKAITFDEQRTIYLTEIRNLFDIYHIFRRIVKNLTTDGSKDTSETAISSLAIYDPIKMRFGDINFQEIPFECNITNQQNKEPNCNQNTFINIQEKWFEHIRIQYALFNSKNQSEVNENSIKFVNNIFKNINSNFTLRYFDLIVRCYYPAALRYSLTMHGLVNE